MIPIAGRAKFWSNVPSSVWNSWKWQKRNSITSLKMLRELIPGIPTQGLKESPFKFSISPYYASLIDNTLSCPIRQQAIPSPLETQGDTDSEEDPLKEEKGPVPGLTHRYPDRVLLYVNDSCAMYCRHCTRRRKVSDPDSRVLLGQSYDYIRKNKIRDVILSGGDPLLLPSSVLGGILRSIEACSSVEIIRIGSRVPVTLPCRVNKELLSVLSSIKKPIYLNTHFNHPRECTKEALDACKGLFSTGCVLSNQMVLLKGINDSVSVVRELNKKLLMMKVRPYYIFQCDPVRGLKHFRTSVQRGLQIIEGLRGHTSGLAVPHFVIDTYLGKIPLLPNSKLTRVGDCIKLKNYEGKEILYKDLPFI